MNRIAAGAALVLGAALAPLRAAETIWRLDNTARIGGQPVTIEGQPRVEVADGGKTLVFDGAHDGVFIPTIPIKGAKAFTIEVLFRPDEDGQEAQRFVHTEDKDGRRSLIELRLDHKGSWWLDTFLTPGANSRGLPLIDPKLTHPTGKWYWAAQRYDGKTMTSFVNGQQELQGEVAFPPFGDGKVSVGVRQNKVFWFKGAIREVRYHDEALAPEKLQRVK